MPNDEIITIDNIEINESTVKTKGDSLFFVADILTTDFAPVDVMKRDAWTFKGKEMRFRHQIPEQDVDALVGHIHDAWFDEKDSKIKTLNEVWGNKPSLKKLQQQVKKKELSISAGYKKTSDEKQNIVGIYGRELSLTPSPKCTKEMGCKIATIIQNELNKPMAEKEGEYTVKDVIEKLEATVIKQNTERGEKIVTLEATIDAMEKRLHDANELLSEVIEQNEKLEKENKSLKSEKVGFSTLPLRQEIVGLEDITDEDAKKKEMEELLQMNEAQLTGLKERILRAKKIAVKVNKEKPVVNGEGIEQNSNTEFDNLDKMTPEQLAMRVNPQLGNYIKAIKGIPSAPPGFNSSGKDGDVPMIN